MQLLLPFRAEGNTLRRGKLGRDLPALQGYGVATGFRTLPVGWQKTLLRAGPFGSPAHCRQKPLGRRKAHQPWQRSPLCCQPRSPSSALYWQSPPLHLPFQGGSFSPLCFLFHWFLLLSILFPSFTFFGFILPSVFQLLQVEF